MIKSARKQNIILFGALKNHKGQAQFPLVLVAPIIAGLAFATLATSLVGCGGGGSSSKTPPQPIVTPSSTPTPTPTPTSSVMVVVQPGMATVSPLSTLQFTPQVSNTSDSGITFSLVEGASGGNITGDGLYTAPLTAGTYHLTVTSHADPSQVATATITVANRVNLTPTSQTVTLSDTIAFSTQVPGTTDQSVTWKVLESGGGTVSPTGVYVAPRVAGTFHIYAASVQDPTKAAIATVTVQAGSVKGGIQ